MMALEGIFDGRSLLPIWVRQNPTDWASPTPASDIVFLVFDRPVPAESFILCEYTVDGQPPGVAGFFAAPKSLHARYRPHWFAVLVPADHNEIVLKLTVWSESKPPKSHKIELNIEAAAADSEPELCFICDRVDPNLPAFAYPDFSRDGNQRPETQIAKIEVCEQDKKFSPARWLTPTQSNSQIHVAPPFDNPPYLKLRLSQDIATNQIRRQINGEDFQLATYTDDQVHHVSHTQLTPTYRPDLIRTDLKRPLDAMRTIEKGQPYQTARREQIDYDIPSPRPGDFIFYTASLGVRDIDVFRGYDDDGTAKKDGSPKTETSTAKNDWPLHGAHVFEIGRRYQLTLVQPTDGHSALRTSATSTAGGVDDELEPPVASGGRSASMSDKIDALTRVMGEICAVPYEHSNLSATYQLSALPKMQGQCQSERAHIQCLLLSAQHQRVALGNDSAKSGTAGSIELMEENAELLDLPTSRLFERLLSPQLTLIRYADQETATKMRELWDSASRSVGGSNRSVDELTTLDDALETLWIDVLNHDANEVEDWLFGAENVEKADFLVQNLSSTAQPLAATMSNPGQGSTKTAGLLSGQAKQRAQKQTAGQTPPAPGTYNTPNLQKTLAANTQTQFETARSALPAGSLKTILETTKSFQEQRDEAVERLMDAWQQARLLANKPSQKPGVQGEYDKLDALHGRLVSTLPHISDTDFAGSLPEINAAIEAAEEFNEKYS